MADPEHLAIIKQGVNVWNEWRRADLTLKPSLALADLTGACLPAAILARADLTGADLTRAGLSGAILNGTILTGADLTGAILNGARLPSADLTEAKLPRADLNGAILSGTILTGADLTGAILSWARLPSADLTGADLSGAILNGAILNGADLTGADLTGADLTGASLTGADLTGAILNGARLFDTILGNLDLSQTIGIEHCVHLGPSIIDIRTVQRSGTLPLTFLRGVGLPDMLIDYLPSLLNQAIQLYSCFISYSAKDQAFAERMHADLQSKGVRCWFAPHDLPIGAKTWDAIDQAVRLHEKLLVILSRCSLESDWVADEVSKAFAEERRRKQPVLFPVRIDNAVMRTDEPWAVKLRDQRNIGDFTRWKDHDAYRAAFERLLRDLKKGEAPAAP